MKPAPQRVTSGIIIVRAEASRRRIELFPVSPKARLFLMNNCHVYGSSRQHQFFASDGARTLIVSPAYDFQEVLDYFKSYDEDQ